eukprot:1813388-Amphidinium_carterae.1
MALGRLLQALAPESRRRVLTSEICCSAINMSGPPAQIYQPHRHDFSTCRQPSCYMFRLFGAWAKLFRLATEVAGITCDDEFEGRVQRTAPCVAGHYSSVAVVQMI